MKEVNRQMPNAWSWCNSEDKDRAWLLQNGQNRSEMPIKQKKLRGTNTRVEDIEGMEGRGRDWWSEMLKESVSKCQKHRSGLFSDQRGRGSGLNTESV